jgi:hypothetical protein
MCIIFSPKTVPSATHLACLPTVFKDKAYRLLAYTNDLRIENDSQGLMVVAVPYDSSKGPIGLVDLSTKGARAFAKGMRELGDSVIPWRPYVDRSGEVLLLDLDHLKPKPIKVHTVGSYLISVATSLDDLEGRIDWEAFSAKDFDLESRRATLADPTLFPAGQTYAYVVAEAVKDVCEEGFGLLYPDPGYAFFPTCHENDKPSTDFHSYDVWCYDFGVEPRTSFPFTLPRTFSLSYDGFKSPGGYSAQPFEAKVAGKDGKAQAVPLRISMGMISLINKLPTQAIDQNSGKLMEFSYDKSKIYYLNFCPIKTLAANQNMSLV